MKLPPGLQKSKHLTHLQTMGSHQLRPHGQTRALLCCPDNKTFWSASGNLVRWDSQLGTPLDSASILAESLSFYKGDLVVLATHGLFLKQGPQLRPIHQPTRQGQCHYATFSRDGYTALVSGSFGCQLWNVDGSKRRDAIKSEGYKEERISPDGKSVLFYSKGLRLSSLAGKDHWSITGDFHAANFLDDDTILVTTRSGALAAIDARSSAPRWSTQLSDGPLHEPVSSDSHIAVDDGEVIYILDHQGRLRCTIDDNKIEDNQQIALSPLGDWLVVCHNRELLKIYDLPSGRERLSRAGHSSRIQGLEWISPSEVLSAASDDKYVRRWDIKTGETSWLTEMSSEHVQTMILLPDRQSFLVEFGDDLLEQRSLSTGDLLHQQKAQSSGSMGFSRDGRYLLMAPSIHSRSQPSLAAFAYPQTKPQWTAPGGYHETVKSLFFSHDNRSVWAFSDRSAKRYELETGQETLRCSPRYREEYSGVQLMRDGITAIGGISKLDDSGYYPDDFVRRWNLETNQQEWSINASGTIHLSAREEWFILVLYQCVELRRTSNGERFDVLDLSPLDDFITRVSLSPDETKLAIGTDRGVILIYALRDL